MVSSPSTLTEAIYQPAMLCFKDAEATASIAKMKMPMQGRSYSSMLLTVRIENLVVYFYFLYIHIYGVELF